MNVHMAYQLDDKPQIYIKLKASATKPEKDFNIRTNNEKFRLETEHATFLH